MNRGASNQPKSVESSWTDPDGKYFVVPQQNGNNFDKTTNIYKDSRAFNHEYFCRIISQEKYRRNRKKKQTHRVHSLSCVCVGGTPVAAQFQRETHGRQPLGLTNQHEKKREKRRTRRNLRWCVCVRVCDRSKTVRNRLKLVRLFALICGSTSFETSSHRSLYWSPFPPPETRAQSESRTNRHSVQDDKSCISIP